MKKTILIFLFFQIAVNTSVFSQEEFVKPQSKFLTKFSFSTLSGGIIIVKAGIDNFPDSLNFVFDTGSGGISLDSLTAAELHIATQKTDRTVRGIAGLKKVDFAFNHALRLPGLMVDSLDFHINNYELLSSVYGVRIDGIIGFSFLKRYIVKVDFEHYVIEVHSPGYIKYPKGGYLLHAGFNSLPYHSVTIEGNATINGKFILDTGAGLCVLFSQDFVDDSLPLNKKYKIFATQTEGIGGKKEMGLTIAQSVRFGPYRFKKVPAYIFNDEYNVTSYPFFDGVIGNDLMRRFNIIINYPDQIFYFKPNIHFGDFFDYSYTGLGIYDIDGDVKIIDIIPNSPGDKAGLKENDIILAIDNNISKNIQTYKTLLQNANSVVKLLILRNNQPLEINLKIKNILKRK